MEPTYTIHTVGVLAQVAGLNRVWDNSQAYSYFPEVWPSFVLPSKSSRARVKLLSVTLMDLWAEQIQGALL